MKNTLKSSLLAGVISLLSLFNLKDSTLKDIAKPYLGEYECREARFRGEDYLNKFSYIYLELKKDGEYLLAYCEKDKSKQETTGKYSYDKEKQTLSLFSSEYPNFKKDFPFKNGKIDICIKLAGETLLLRFEQK